MRNGDQTQQEEDMDALFEKIKLGIDSIGMHVVWRDSLGCIWNNNHPKSRDKKELEIINFAGDHGFSVQLGNGSFVAIFRKLD